MNYAEIKKYDAANGPGIRTTLFLSGCTFYCKNCFNKDLQDFNYGYKWNNEIEDDFIEHAKNPIIDGISILGGEPLMQDYKTLINLLKKLKEVNKPIWLWTGYLYEELIKDEEKKEILKHIDVLIDGRFEEDKKDLSIKYRGSSNQRVLKLKDGKIDENLCLQK